MKKTLIISALMLIITTGCVKNDKQVNLLLISDVQIEEVSKKPVESFYTTSATVKAKANSVIASMLTGRVTSILVEEGDFVKKGELLLTIEAQDLTQKTEAAQMAVSSAEQNAKMLERTYKRYKNLYDEKVITKQEFDQWTTQRNIAQLQYKQAQAVLGEVKVLKSYSKVSAPVSGIIIKKNIDVGSTAVQGMPLFTIEASDEGIDSELIANVDESYLEKVKEGMNVILETGDKTFNKKITKVVKYIDPLSRTFKVKIDITGVTGGRFAKMSIPVGEKEAITIPKIAVVQKGQLTGVYTVDSKNIISYRLVRTGKAYNDNVEILSGLSDGDKIITIGAEKAVDGAKIK